VVWSTNGATPCLCAPAAAVNSANVVINHTINMNAAVVVSGTGLITISNTGTLSHLTNTLDIQAGGSLISNGTISLNVVRIRASASATFNGPVTAATSLRIEGSATLNALTTVTNGNIEFRTGSAVTVMDGWSANLPNGDVVNEGTMTFDGNITSILNGDFTNAATGFINGFAIIETKNGNITNNGSWDIDVDWCSAGTDFGLSDSENCLDTNAIASGTCNNAYILDWKDPSTYTVTCGDVNASNWSVKGLTCLFNSPVFNAGGSVGGPNLIADWSVRINQSGNVDANDSAMVYYYLDGALVRTDIYAGIGSPAVFTSARRILVRSGSTYEVEIKLLNDKANELWQIKSNDITVCLLPVFAPPSPLPITLAGFTAKAQNENSVLLSWITMAEVNNDYFTLERSQNGTQFSTLATVEGSGNTTDIRKYLYTDKNPLGGTSYYRLKQTDFNGTSVTFKPVSVSLDSKTNEAADLRITPNPFSESLTAQFDLSEDQEITIQLLSLGGVVVFSKEIFGDAGNNQYRFSVPVSLKAGTYFLRISNAKSVLASAKVICRK
jgi:hypothetical protein